MGFEKRQVLNLNMNVKLV